jgi:phospho-N-acetylmuramoyl-pentapeptide-transferase
MIISKYLKRIKKDWQAGLKLLVRLGLSLIIGWTMYFNSDITIQAGPVKLPVKYDVPVEYQDEKQHPGLYPGCKIAQNNYAVLEK